MAGNVKEYFAPTLAGLLAHHTICLFSPEMLGMDMLAWGSATLAAVASGANNAFHHPLILSSPFTINQFFWLNNATVNGNTDIGVYSEGGTLLVHSGPVANAGANSRQAVDITDYTLPAGVRLWLTIGTDSATHQYTRATVSAPEAEYLGVKSMTSGLSGSNLVTPATFAAGSNTAIICGMTGASVI